MCNTITLKSTHPVEEIKTVLNDALQKELSFANLRYESFHNECKLFEDKFKMDSNLFFDKFESGRLGDDLHWFDWYAVYRGRELWKNKFNIINEISWS